MGDEKRKNTRVSFNTHVVLKCNEVEIMAVAGSKDISMKGIFVETDRKLPVGTQCDVGILLSGTTSTLSLSMKGIIVRDTPTGMGIHFESIEVDSYYHLKNLIMYNSSNPDAIEDEILSIE